MLVSAIFARIGQINGPQGAKQQRIRGQEVPDAVRVVEFRQNAFFVDVAILRRRFRFVRSLHDGEEISGGAPQNEHEEVEDEDEFRLMRPQTRIANSRFFDFIQWSMDHQDFVSEKRDKHRQDARAEEELRHVRASDDRVE